MVVGDRAAGAVPLPVAHPASSHAPAGQMIADVTGAAANRETTGADPTQSRNAARSRMRECGHQWSAMKRNGTANGMTWKDFSQGCLAKQ